MKPTVKKFPTKTIAICALLSALTMGATAVIAIPVPATGGFLNLGDGVLLFAGVVFGPIVGATVGGIGSMLADLALGYVAFMPATLIAKGLEGALAGLIFLMLGKIKLNRHIAAWISIVPSVTVMMLGYFFAERIMFGSWATAAAEIPGNCIQGAVGAAVCYLILIATMNIKGFSILVGKNYFYDYVIKGKSNVEASENTTTDTVNSDFLQDDGGEH